jgi:D-glycero-alpha-D-manno-heptose-7-phosphate kinase
MIISRTPYRISFVGGGTDYHPWYQQHGAAVLATSINHYCYITARVLPPFFKHFSRIIWSKVEEVMAHSAIEHPSVRACLEYLHINHGIEIAHQGDLPARSGLGSSSAFTVGLLHALYALRGEMVGKRVLACEAVHIERDVLKENVGVQDQIQTAYGGLNKISIRQNGDFTVQPMILAPARLQELQDHLLLFFTGLSRTASEIAGEKIKSISQKEKELHQIHNMVDIGAKILTDNNDITDFGLLLDEAWQLKRGLAQGITTSFIDETYARAKKAGAIGGKVLGAGGGGFMLFLAPPEQHAAIKAALSDLLHVPFNFENSGSQIIFYDSPRYIETDLTKRNYHHLNQDTTELEVKKAIHAIRRDRIAIVPMTEDE